MRNSLVPLYQLLPFSAAHACCHFCGYCHSCAADVDFQSGDYNATFQAGDRTATAAIVLIDDDLVESIEGFVVSIVEVPGMFHINPGPSLFVDIIDDESKCKKLILNLPYIY